MRIEVKLYAYHDMDLVALYKTGMVSFPETTKQILNSYARKEVFKIKMQEINEERLARYYPKATYKKFYHYHIFLNEKTDKDAIELIHSITPGCRNNFIKVLLRQYIGAVFPPEYSVDGTSKMFDEMAELFRKEKEEKEIKEVKSKKDTKNKAKNKNIQHIEIDDNKTIKLNINKESDIEDKIENGNKLSITSVTTIKDDKVDLNSISESNEDKTNQDFINQQKSINESVREKEITNDTASYNCVNQTQVHEFSNFNKDIHTNNNEISDSMHTKLNLQSDEQLKANTGFSSNNNYSEQNIQNKNNISEEFSDVISNDESDLNNVNTFDSNSLNSDNYVDDVDDLLSQLIEEY